MLPYHIVPIFPELQILHIKLNHLTGTISSGFGKLPHISWFDVSTNHLRGTIPESFSESETLKDFRLGGGSKSFCLYFGSNLFAFIFSTPKNRFVVPKLY